MLDPPFRGAAVGVQILRLLPHEVCCSAVVLHELFSPAVCEDLHGLLIRAVHIAYMPVLREMEWSEAEDDSSILVPFLMAELSSRGPPFSAILWAGLSVDPLFPSPSSWAKVSTMLDTKAEMLELVACGLSSEEGSGAAVLASRRKGRRKRAQRQRYSRARELSEEREERLLREQARAQASQRRARAEASGVR